MLPARLSFYFSFFVQVFDCVLAFFRVLGDVTLFKEDALGGDPPFRSAAEEKLQIHAEMQEFLFLGVLHDFARLVVLLDGDTLLIPVDGLTFFLKGSNEACKGARFRREFVCWLMILLKALKISPFHSEDSTLSHYIFCGLPKLKFILAPLRA